MSALVPTENESSDLAALADPAKEPRTKSAPKLSPEEQAALSKLAKKAGVIRTLAFPAAMATAVPVAEGIGAAAFKLFLDRVRREAGAPIDPVEQMLIEQLTLAHQRVAQLHAQAERAKSIDEVKILSTAAMRLTGEVRRLALALRQYREPSRKQFTVVKQQNLSTGGQQIAYLEQNETSQDKVPLISAGTKQGGKQLEPRPHRAGIPEPQTPGGREEEPAFSWSADARGTRTAAANSLAEPALAAFDGAENGGRQGPIGR